MRRIRLSLTLNALFNPKDFLGTCLKPYSRIKASILVLVLSVFYLLTLAVNPGYGLNVYLVYSLDSRAGRELRLVQKSPMAHRKFSQYHAASTRYVFKVVFWWASSVEWIVSNLSPRCSLYKLLSLNRQLLKFSGDFFFIHSVQSSLPIYLQLAV